MSTDTNTQFGMETGVKHYSAGSVVIAAVVGAVVAFLLSWIYGPLEYYLPLIILNLVLTQGMGWLLGGAARKMVRAKRINAMGAAGFVGLVTGLSAAFFSWLSYFWTLAEFDFTAYSEILFSPAYYFGLIRFFANEPVWSYGKAAMPNIFYYAVWLAEALALIGYPVIMCRTFVRENLLCDSCGEWVAPTGDIALFDPAPEVPSANQASLETVEGITRMVNDFNLSRLLSLPRMNQEDPAMPRLEVVGLACPYCQDKDSFVNIVLVSEIEGKKKKMETVRVVAARHVPVPVELEKEIFEPAAPPPSQAHGEGENAPPAAGPDSIKSM